MRLQNLIAVSVLAIAVPNLGYAYEETRSKANYFGIDYLDWKLDGSAISPGAEVEAEGAAITLGRDINNFLGIELQAGTASGATLNGVEQYDAMFLSLLGRFSLHFDYISPSLVFGYSMMVFDPVSPTASDREEGAFTLGGGTAFFLSPNFAINFGSTAYFENGFDDFHVAWRLGVTRYFDWPRLHPRY